MSQQALENGIIAKLTADTGSGTFAAALGSRIYVHPLPDSPTEPYCVVTVISDPPDRYLGAPGAGIDANVQIDLFGAEGGELQSINALLEALLDDATLTVSGFAGVTIQCTDRGRQRDQGDERVAITSQWHVWGT